jgi:glycosyltransferase involved in cell wall biosynthesis
MLDSIGAAVRLVKTMYELAKALAGEVKTSLFLAVARSGWMSTNAAHFKDGDLLLSPGGSWESRSYCAAVARLKERAALKFVPLIYDLIPYKFPHFFPHYFPPRFKDWLAQTLRLSDAIVTISENSRRDIVHFATVHGIRRPPVEVIRLGDTATIRARAIRPAQLPEAGAPYVLCVGTLEVRKNHALLYYLWRRLTSEYGPAVPRLLIAGSAGWLTHELRYQIEQDPVVRDKIVVLSEVTDSGLSWLYQNCLFTVYPSHYEGWGLPLAESLAHGKYCIASGTSSLPEVGGDLVSYHDPVDLAQCQALVIRAWFDNEYRAHREQLIQRHFRATSWEGCARRLWAILQTRVHAQPATLSPCSHAAAPGGTVSSLHSDNGQETTHD